MATERIHAQGSLASLRRLPVRKLSTRYTTKPPARMPEFEMITPPQHKPDVVVAVTETTSEEPEQTDPPTATTSIETEANTSRPRVRPQPPALAIPPKARLSPPKAAPNPPPETSLPSPPPDRAPSAAEIALPPSRSETPQNRVETPEPQTAETPAMRSMFPTYDYALPLAQQDYRPNAEAVPEATLSEATAGPSSNNPFRRHRSSLRMDGVGAVAEPADPKESPLRRSESLRRASAVSTSSELQSLWDIANGQSYHEAADSYTLELSCDDLTLNSEIINFSSADSINIYTLAATSAPSPTVQTSRANPTDPGIRIPICGSTVARPSQQDPLISTMFPKLAGLLALDEASSASISQGLNRTASDLAQTHALQIAQAKEASLLLWDADSGRFCILHPSLLDNAATTLAISITPTPAAPSSIIIYAPETETPLLTLNLTSLTLTIHAQAITALPSLYILDTLMTALLTLLLHLHRFSAEPSTTQHTTAHPHPYPSNSPPQITQTTFTSSNGLYFPPPPSSNAPSRTSRYTRTAKPSRSRSLFRSKSTPATGALPSSTITPPPLAHASTAPFTTDIEMGHLTPSGHSLTKTLTNNSAHPSQQHAKDPNTKTMKPLFDPNDEDLPSGTRAALKGVYWVFEVLFWLLSVLAQVAAGLVVAGGKMITKL